MVKHIIRKLMAPLKARIYGKEGITLIELLVTVAIMGILLPVIYGAFMTGYKIYEKIQIQSQLREDADYVSSMMMQALYSTPFDEVGECKDKPGTCLEVRQNYTANVTQVQNSQFFDVTKAPADQASPLFIKIVQGNGTQNEIKIGDKLLHTSSDFKGSTFSVHCSENGGISSCKQGGTIQLQLKITNDIHNQTIDLNSEFGF